MLIAPHCNESCVIMNKSIVEVEPMFIKTYIIGYCKFLFVSLGHYVGVLGLVEDLAKVASDDELGRKLQDIKLMSKQK